MDRIKLNYNGIQEKAIGPEIMSVNVSENGYNIQIMVPQWITAQLPLDEHSVNTICECVRRVLSNTPHGNNA